MTEPVPQRIGDAERDDAVKRLREHLAVGRLAPYEFNERMEKALSAKTDADLAPLFSDLPETSDRPYGLEPLAPLTDAPVETTASSGESALGRIAGWAVPVAWPLALIFSFATGWRYWWVILIPALLMPALLGTKKGDPREGRSERAALRRERDKQRKGIDQG